MAYIGRSVDIGMFEKQVLTPNSSTTTFTLNFAVGSANSLLVVYGGVIQEPNVAYAVSGGGQQIVFSEAPATGTTLYIIYLGKQLTTPRTAGQETTKQTFTGDGTTTLFTLTDPPVVPAGIMVFVDGILQREGVGGNYVSSGSTINFDAAPDNGAEIDVYTLVKEKVSIDTVADGSITRAKLAQSAPYWDAAGNFGIGVSPTNALDVYRASSGVSAAITSASTGTSDFADLAVVGNDVRGRISAYGTNHTARSNQVWVNANTNTPLILSTNNTERVRIASGGQVGLATQTPDPLYNMTIQRVVGSSGNIVLQGDNVTIGMPNILFKNTNGGATAYLGFNGDAITAKAIAFPSSQVSSSDPNTLDDYEEGNWTPDIEGSSTAGSQAGTRSGRYVKIGKMVFYTISLQNYVLTGAAGNLLIKNLPFTMVARTGGGFVAYMEGFNPVFNGTVDDRATLGFRLDSSTSYTFRPNIANAWDSYVVSASTTWNGGPGSTYGEICLWGEAVS